jgi:hypothetical protein
LIRLKTDPFALALSAFMGGWHDSLTICTLAETVAIIRAATPDLPASQGKTVAYATRRIGSTWPGPVWTKCRENVIVPPEFELVRVTIEPVE